MNMVGEWTNDKKDQEKTFFERKLLLNGTLAECLEKAEKDELEMFS